MFFLRKLAEPEVCLERGHLQLSTGGGKWKENVSEEMGANGFRSEIYRAPIWMHEVRSSLAVLDKERRSTNRAEYG